MIGGSITLPRVTTERTHPLGSIVVILDGIPHRGEHALQTWEKRRAERERQLAS